MSVVMGPGSHDPGSIFKGHSCVIQVPTVKAGKVACAVEMQESIRTEAKQVVGLSEAHLQVSDLKVCTQLYQGMAWR